MSQDRVMALKQAKANRDRMKAVKWFSYTSSMVEMRFGERPMYNPPYTDYRPAKKMHNYRMIVDGGRVVRRTTSKGREAFKASVAEVYESVTIVEIDGRDVHIKVR